MNFKPIFTTILTALLLSLSYAQPNSSGVWEIRHCVDEFGDPTNEFYMQATTEGTFSTSTHTGEKLTAKIMISKDGEITLFLYHYGKSTPYSWDNDEYTVRTKDDTGNINTFYASIALHGSLKFNEYDATSLRALFTQNTSIKFYIENNRDKNYTYNFVLDCTNFLQTYNQLKPTIPTLFSQQAQ